MQKKLKYLPILLWIIYTGANFKKSYSLMTETLDAISLSREFTVGGFPQMYNIAAYSSFFDEIVLLLIAVIAFTVLKKRDRSNNSDI